MSPCAYWSTSAMPPSQSPGFPWVSPGMFFLHSFLYRKAQHSLQQSLLSPTMLGSYPTLLFQPKKPSKILMQGVALKHHLLCNQPDSGPVLLIWFSWVTLEVKSLSEIDKKPTSDWFKSKRESVDRTEKARGIVASGMAGSKCSKQDSLFLQVLLLFATMMLSFLDRPFYVVAKMYPSSHCLISHWLRNSSKEKSVYVLVISTEVPGLTLIGSVRSHDHLWPNQWYCNLSSVLGGISPTQNRGTESWGREDSQADSRRGSDAVWVETVLP